MTQRQIREAILIVWSMTLLWLGVLIGAVLS